VETMKKNDNLVYKIKHATSKYVC